MLVWTWLNVNYMDCCHHSCCAIKLEGACGWLCLLQCNCFGLLVLTRIQNDQIWSVCQATSLCISSWLIHSRVYRADLTGSCCHVIRRACCFEQERQWWNDSVQGAILHEGSAEVNWILVISCREAYWRVFNAWTLKSLFWRNPCSLARHQILNDFRLDHGLYLVSTSGKK